MKQTRWLLIVLLSLVLGATGAMAQGLDADNDGVLFRSDNCPNEAGPPENSGCPFVMTELVMPTQTDTDGDGLPDSDDQCPTVAGPRENRGCPTSNTPPNPPADSDADGTNDPDDRCPTVAGPRENRGCPPADDPVPATDTDGDGLPDSDDQCPTVAGPRENRGCPPADNPPPNEPPSSEPPSSVPPFTPPALPTDGCYVTPANGNQINVRKAPNMAGDILGFLLPGVVYAADGYVMNGVETWYVLSVYENSAGDTGYAAGSVVQASACPERVPDDASTRPEGADGFAGNPLPDVTLCYLSVGYDPAFYGSGYDAALGNESITYASFYFELEPGEPIQPGTPIWGVVSIDGYNELPPDSPLAFLNPDNAVAVASDPAVIAAAMNGGLAVAFDLAFPNPNGGIMAPNGTTFYRLSSPEHIGNCGPIVSIDDFASLPDDGVVQALQCFTQPGTTLVESCWCESSDSDCVDQLVDICWGGGAYIDAGPDMTACWWVDVAPPSGDLVQAGRSDIDPATRDTVGRQLDATCEDDLNVWWIEVPNPYGDPFDLQDVSGGNCEGALDGVFDTQPAQGMVRLVVGRSDDNVTDPTGTTDCDENGIPDIAEFPQPICGDLTSDMPDGNSAKETAGWWAEVLNLTCGGSDWIIMLEIDEDGDEVVTDAQCVDDIE